MDIVLSYFLSLLKRSILFAILSSIVFLISVAHGYSYMQAAAVYGNFMFISIPCILWVQQMVVAGIDRSRRGNAHAITLIIGSLFCSILVLSLFPMSYTKETPNFRSRPITYSIPTDTIILNNGVILFDSSMIPMPTNSRAALVSGRTLFFTNVITNDARIILEGPSSVEVPRDGGYEALNSGYYAQESALFFLKNIAHFHQYLTQLYTHYGLANNPLGNIQQLLLFGFLLTGLYLWASLIGLIIGHGQNYLGAIALTFFIGCGLSAYLVRALGGVSYTIPGILIGETFVVGSAVFGILVLCVWEIFSTRRKRS